MTSSTCSSFSFSSSPATSPLFSITVPVHSNPVCSPFSGGSDSEVAQTAGRQKAEKEMEIERERQLQYDAFLGTLSRDFKAFITKIDKNFEEITKRVSEEQQRSNSEFYQKIVQEITKYFLFWSVGIFLTAFVAGLYLGAYLAPRYAPHY